MKFLKFSKTAAHILVLLGISKIPIEEGKVNFTDDQKAKLDDVLGEEQVQAIIDGFNRELEAVDKGEKDLEKVKAEIKAELDESGFTDEEQAEILGSDDLDNLDISAQFKQLTKNYQEIKATMLEQKKTIDALMGAPEDNLVEKIKKTAMSSAKLNHSATHLFSDATEYNAFENRPWNERLRNGDIKATDFSSDVHVPVLKGDLDHFIRKNPGVIESLFNDTDTLPAEWDRISGVEDIYTTAAVIPSEVIQGRSTGWNPKGKVKIALENMRVFAKKIDITFNGQELQKLENTWIASVQNLDGSHPWKMSFIFWILSHLIIAARRDERVAMVRGIFVQSPAGDGAEKAGKAIHSQNGLMWNWWYYRDVAKKYTAFSMGVPSPAGIVDYIRQMIESIPEDERNESGFEIQWSRKWQKIYETQAGLIYDLKRTPDQGKQDYDLNHPIDYPNFKFQPLKDMTNTDFIGIVKSKNVAELNFRPEEKNQLTMTHEKRYTHFFGDYKSGIGFKQVGIKGGEGYNFERQLLYSNDVPVFGEDVSIPVFDDETGILQLNFTNVKVDKEWKTDITEIKGLELLPYDMDLKGKVIKITGDTTLVNATNVVHNANKIVLADGVNFNLKSGGTLTLFAQEDGKFKELSRTSAPAIPADGAIKFDGDTIDANEGTTFKFTATAAVTFDEILNGVEGKVITIVKTVADTNGALTIATGNAKVVVGTNAVLDALNDTISFVKAGDVWYETSRTIA